MAMPGRALTSLALVTLVSAATLAAVRQDVTLRYRWTKGESVRYRFTQESTSTISGLPGGMPDLTIGQTTSQTFKATAQDVAADGTATVEEVVESMKMNMDSPMGKMGYDSASTTTPDDPAGTMLKRLFTPMIGASFRVTVAPTGEISKVEGVSQMAEKMFGSVQLDPQMEGMLSGAKAVLSDEGMKSMFSQGFGQLPKQALKAGETWKASFTTTNPAIGGLITSVVATLQGVEGSGADQVARISTKLTITQDPSIKVTNPMGFTIKLGETAGEGEVLFDIAKGRARRAVTRMTMPMAMSGSGPDGNPMDMRTNVKTTSTIEVVQ